MTREQLDQRARELGHPAPERLPNKAAVEAAINELESKMSGSGDDLETGGITEPIGPFPGENIPAVETEADNPPVEIEVSGPEEPLPPVEDDAETRAAAAIYAEAGNPGDFADVPEETRDTFLRYARAALSA